MFWAETATWSYLAKALGNKSLQTKAFGLGHVWCVGVKTMLCLTS